MFNLQRALRFTWRGAEVQKVQKQAVASKAVEKIFADGCLNIIFEK
jgi:hypothetical protein